MLYEVIRQSSRAIVYLRKSQCQAWKSPFKLLVREAKRLAKQCRVLLLPLLASQNSKRRPYC